MVAVQFTLTKLGDKEMVEEGEGWIVHMGIAAVDGVSPNLVRKGGFCASAVGSTDAGLFVV